MLPTLARSTTIAERICDNTVNPITKANREGSLGPLPEQLLFPGNAEPPGYFPVGIRSISELVPEPVRIKLFMRNFVPDSHCIR